MEAVFWIGVAWMVYVYAGYPAILAILGLVRRVHPKSSVDYLPRVSVLISARNEEKDIGWKVAETLAWDYPSDRLEILIASDASSDRTDDIVRDVTDQRVKLVRMERRGGKARALNQLAELAAGELLFLTDANSHIGPHCLRRMTRHFADPQTGCVTGHSSTPQSEGERKANGGSVVYWGFETLVRRLESAIGSVLVCDGAIFMIRASLFRPLSPDLANDLELPVLAGGGGAWILDEPDAIVMEQDTSSPAEEYARRRRICGQGVLGAWELRRSLRGLRGWQFVSHKCLRWLTLAPLACILAGSAAMIHEPAFLFLLCLEALFAIAATAGLVVARRGAEPAKVLSVPLYIMLTSVGALAGFIDACRGRRFDIWESPALTRSGKTPMRATQ